MAFCAREQVVVTDTAVDMKRTVHPKAMEMEDTGAKSNQKEKDITAKVKEARTEAAKEKGVLTAREKVEVRTEALFM